MVTIPFGHDSTKPLVEGREVAVRPLLDWLAAHPGASVSVEGHADTVGTEDYNIVLSFGRARAVAAWLGRLGVAPSRIAPRAAGTTPAKGASADVSTNRLVVLQIEGVDVCRVPGDATKRP
jgi:outer membrane protein OmpA-like peptidoglycan-associated protein